MQRDCIGLLEFLGGIVAALAMFWIVPWRVGGAWRGGGCWGAGTCGEGRNLGSLES